ncbi:hypothetical protein CDAR_93321 [Caerostris darwini]|uniref:Uncharacterized protein n=1 Tax=Caerostris darwini TaxID=1538125 RepID=A0AAV4QER9_9ARAC|nr:hypothetical protein CDAR_93321 [Caerostris darwini]
MLVAKKCIYLNQNTQSFYTVKITESSEHSFVATENAAQWTCLRKQKVLARKKTLFKNKTKWENAMDFLTLSVDSMIELSVGARVPVLGAPGKPLCLAYTLQSPPKQVACSPERFLTAEEDLACVLTAS